MAYCKRVDTQRITDCAAAVLAKLFKLPAFGKERGGAMRVLAGCHACFSVIFLVFMTIVCAELCAFCVADGSRERRVMCNFVRPKPF